MALTPPVFAGPGSADVGARTERLSCQISGRDERQGFGHAFEPELAERIGAVHFDGANAQAQPMRRDLVGRTFYQDSKYIALAWRQLRGSSWRRVAPGGTGRVTLTPLGLDSEFMAVLDLLDQHEHRPAHVPPARWLMAMTLPAGIERTVLSEALTLHDRLRFDPVGLDHAQRLRLRELSQALSAKLITASLAPSRRR